MKKTSIILAILIMSIGFASISTTLIINGSNKIKENGSDFEIIFTKATLDNVDVYESVISEDKKTITFISNDLKKKNDTSILNYEITNNSRNYDAEVTINCNAKENTNAEYTSITNVLNAKNNIIKAKEVVDGNVTITLDKVSISEITEEYTCTLEFNAVERTSLGFPIVKLYDYIESNADKNTTINFNINSKTSGTNGIYTTNKTNDGTEVYYYRGNVDNNVIFNNMCWKIIRTTETGGVKLIYNGLPTDGKCNNTGEDTQIGTSAFNTKYADNAYVGYMYGSVGATTYKATHTNTNSSAIKTYIDNWFKNNFDESTQSYLEDTVFCNDRNTKAYDANLINASGLKSHGSLGYGTNPSLYAVLFRASYNSKSLNPTLVCKNTNGTVANNNDSFTVSTENGNGKLTYPVGLITLDEAVYAGLNTYNSNTSDYENREVYLCNKMTYWTMSPIYMGATSGSSIGRLGTYGVIGGRGGNNTDGVRPVISLKSEIKISLSGNGSEENPFVVVE